MDCTIVEHSELVNVCGAQAFFSARGIGIQSEQRFRSVNRCVKRASADDQYLAACRTRRDRTRNGQGRRV
jgi:hypothetical protein